MGVYLAKFDKDVKLVLKTILTQPKTEKFDSVYDECVLECVEQKYVRGITVAAQTADGKYHFEFVKPVVTKKGVEFLEYKNSNLRANIAIAISVFALIVPLLAYIKDIYSNILWIVEFFR